MTLSPELLVAVAAGMLAVAFEYIPGLHPRYDALSPEWKRLVMLGMLILVCLGAFGLGCAGKLAVSCDADGALYLLGLLAVAIAANQGVHSIGKRSGPAT